MVEAQGGALDALPEATGETPVYATGAGYVGAIDGLEVGLCGVALGAGRVRADQAVDHVVGIRLDAPVGTPVVEGQPLATILHGRRGAPDAALVSRLGATFEVSGEPPRPSPLILERID